MILVKVMESPSHADGCSTKHVFRLSGTLRFDNMTSVTLQQCWAYASCLLQLLDIVPSTGKCLACQKI